ncbi:MAG: XisH family protein [Microscillaceae bacterium]|nr:XisH family protein [Microscillaceae bacterium]
MLIKKMSRRDIYHSAARKALEKDGWQITDDPLDLTIGDVELLADLGAERLIAAEKDNEKIAVEIKSFLGQSLVSEFHKALGQYENYRLSLEELDPQRNIWLAISREVWESFFQRAFIQKAIQRYKIEIIVLNTETEEIESWIK